MDGTPEAVRICQPRPRPPRHDDDLPDHDHGDAGATGRDARRGGAGPPRLERRGRRPDRRRPLVRPLLRHGQGRRPSQGLRAQSRPGGVRAGPGTRDHQVGDVRRRASRGGGVLPGGEGGGLPGHLRALQRLLARDGGGVRGRHAPRRSLLERDEQHRFDPQAAGHAAARQHGRVRALPPGDEHRGHRGRLSSRAGDAAVRLSDEGPGSRCAW